eukprot:m.10973 g.10973  ORF g.10973 m.10973 type:complete len:560 (+) comp14611_c0_seq1:1652-3331(+)
MMNTVTRARLVTPSRLGRPTRRPPAAAAAASAPATRTRLIHLLVVDDDLATIEYLGQLLKGFAQISFATNGEDALRLAELHHPDLVLLDVELPDLGGFEVCRRLRAAPALRDIPVIFASSHCDAATEVAALKLGADDFLRKPFDDVQVLARLRTQLRATATNSARPEATASGPARILIIDDDTTSIQLVRSLLADVGECHFALNGAQALALAGELQPDLILLDIDLPDSDGFRVCKQLRADPGLSQVPIMFLTQSSTIGHEARALALGGDDFVRKPFSAPVLYARVRRLVDRKRSQGGRLDAAGDDQAEHERAQARQRRLDEAAIARRATASMLSYIAHEIGNPVNVIKGFAQLMQGEHLSAGQAEKLSHILDAVGRLSGLLAEVTDVARMESGQFFVELGDVDAREVATQACAQIETQAAQAGMRLAVPPPTPHMSVRADARRLRQCLDNLLSNALKYGGNSNHGGPGIEVEIQARGDDIALTVQDHGCGLSEEQLSHLFEPYNRLGREGGAIPGTGLGLMLTRDLVQNMGGQLLVHSKPGHGCRFEILLPASQPPAN